jgi:ATP-dependent Clp protease, protease subunit
MNTIVTETTEQGEIAIDIFQKLSNDRILFISGEIDDDMAADVSATLLLKDSEDSDNKITMFINSRGGDIRNALAIYDVMSMIDAPIETVCIGSAMKEAVILLAAGSPGMRFATKHSIICAGQLVNSMVQQSDLTDAQSLLTFSLSDNKKMMDIIAKKTKKRLKQVMTDFERLVFMDSKQALKYGFIDNIIPFKE